MLYNYDDFLNYTAFDINPKLETKFVKKISNYTNQLVIGT